MKLEVKVLPARDVGRVNITFQCIARGAYPDPYIFAVPKFYPDKGRVDDCVNIGMPRGDDWFDRLEVTCHENKAREIVDEFTDVISSRLHTWRRFKARIMERKTLEL